MRRLNFASTVFKKVGVMHTEKRQGKQQKIPEYPGNAERGLRIAERSKEERGMRIAKLEMRMRISGTGAEGEEMVARPCLGGFSI
ncbi:MAG TPA: hypothetical protein VE242_10690 [Chthoniobacterales bacterium]|nr:hypothetical protein [Chthoniobacterales bacterium]